MVSEQSREKREYIGEEYKISAKKWEKKYIGEENKVSKKRQGVEKGNWRKI